MKVGTDLNYYVLVDGTKATDSVAFAHKLDPAGEVGGWRNLMKFLPLAPGSTSRRVDAAHPFLPIYRLNGSGVESSSGTEVVCPGGKNGAGKDAIWRNYRPAPQTWLLSPSVLNLTKTTVGRHTACEENAAWISNFILEPAIQVDDNGVATILSGESLKPNAVVYRAKLVYVSSHGWQGGFMRGNEMSPWPMATPPQAQGAYNPFHSYFLVGREHANGSQFKGPLWIVLAQCSTLNEVTWVHWAQIMARSDPPVRGILGYEQPAPGPQGAIAIGEAFFKELKKDKTLLEAWSAANRSRKWSAVIHKDAVDDRLQDFANSAISSASLSDYTAYRRETNSHDQEAIPLQDSPGPFTMQLFLKGRRLGTDYVFEVTPDQLDTLVSDFRATRTYTVKINAPTTWTKAHVRWVHVRETDRQIPFSRLFERYETPTDHVDVSPLDGYTLQLSADTPITEAELKVAVHDATHLVDAHLEVNHSYFWLKIRVFFEDGREEERDFKTQGLMY